MSRNPIARDLRTPKYRERVIPDAKLAQRLDRYKAMQDALLIALDGDDDEAFDRVEAEMKAEAAADADWRWNNNWD